MKPKNKTLGYLIPIFALCVFMLVIYGAYVPHKLAETQRVVCIKFKADASAEDIEKHMRDFAMLKKNVKDVVAYSAGKVEKSHKDGEEFDVVHYLTFRTHKSAQKYANDAYRTAFIKENEANWEKVLELTSSIEK
jgi:hypothetical protein